jgi:UDP-2,4-diacetamido-2,4,6-trideoxy-beta-L-altropyranose hydrolase
MTNPGPEATQRQLIAVLRADASASIGAGHVARCLAIAEALGGRGWQCVLVAARGTAEVFPYLAAAGVHAVEVEPQAGHDPAEVGRAAGAAADLVVVDHYGLGRAFESGCRAWARRVLVVTDSPDGPHHCDLLLDQTPGRTAADYARLVPPRAAVLAGESYTLVRRAFLAGRPRALARRGRMEPARHLLVSMGATDPSGHTSRILGELAEAGWPGPITVLLSPAAPHLADLRRRIAALREGRLLEGATADAVAAAMTEADLAIGAAGASTWERCCLGLPAVVLVVAENQRDIAAAVARAQAAVVLERAQEQGYGAIAAAVLSLAGDVDRLRDMSQRAAALCDGSGPERVVDAIEKRL